MGRLTQLAAWVMIGGILTACSGVNSDLKSSLDTIFIATVSDGSSTQVVPLSGITGTGEFDEPDYSPDGTQLVVVGHKNSDLYVCSVNGTTLTQITQTSSITESAPEWAPAGDLIAHIGTKSNGQTGLYIISPDGTNQTLLMSGIIQFGWSPSSTRLWAIDGNRKLYIVYTSGTITDTSYTLSETNSPVWLSADFLQFTTNSSTYIFSSASNSISTIHSVVSGTQALPSTTFIDPTTSPALAYYADATQIISLGQADFVSLSSNGAHIAITLRGAVYTTSSNTLQRTKIFDTSGSTIQSITWGSDNETLFIASSSGVHWAKYDGSASSTLTSIGAGDFDISPDGSSVVYTGTREETL